MSASVQIQNPGPPRIPVYALGMSLGIFLAVIFALCVGFGLALPDVVMYPAWLALFPWVSWMNWPSFYLGLAESFAYGWLVALIFAPLFNLFADRWAAGDRA
jgi:hypothetical protein